MRTKDKSILVKSIPKGAVADEVKALHATDVEQVGGLVASGMGNLPAWSEKDAMIYWSAADQLERKTGPACQQIILSLPKALSVEQGQALVGDFVKEEFGTKAFTYAIRTAEFGSTEPTQAVLLVSGRVQDGIQRDKEHFFRRYRTLLPEFSGCRKDGKGLVRGDLSDPTLTRLQNWKRLCAKNAPKKP